MALCLFFHSILIVFILLFFSRWLDEETLADVCFYSLAIELFCGIFSIAYIYYTDSLFFLLVGSVLPDNFFIQISLLFCFDELSGFFFCILDFALILCFYFLIEYFEYDSNSTGIILLSSLFSHLAIWYFCVFDVFLLVVFWEGISLVSFLLIQHWSYRLPSYKAGIKVFFISQLGDVPLFFFVFLLLNRFGTTDLGEILSQLFLLSFEYIHVGFSCLISLSSALALLLSAAMLLKAAQFFFYPWLLDAMEAPVPISAQLHSSTLVIIGFYVFLRFQNLFILAPNVSFVILFFGVITVVGASILGFFQEDGKKLLACSTASQLGYAVTGLGLHYFEEALLLMTFCCCNKAFTFIWFGALMDRHAGISDFRFISGVLGVSTLEHVGILVSVANFTIFPGAFSWHIKALFLKGQYPFESLLVKYALDVLSLTWFFSSLYLLYLYIVLFLKPNRAVTRNFYLTKAQFKMNFQQKFNLKMILNLVSSINFSASLLHYVYVVDQTTGNKRISTSFFCLLLLSFIILLSPTNVWFYTYVDVTWVVDSFYFNNFFINNFYA